MTVIANNLFMRRVMYFSINPSIKYFFTQSCHLLLWNGKGTFNGILKMNEYSLPSYSLHVRKKNKRNKWEW